MSTNRGTVCGHIKVTRAKFETCQHLTPNRTATSVLQSLLVLPDQFCRELRDGV